MTQVRKVAAEFPEVRLDDFIIDAMAAHLVRDPSSFDVIVTTNFYADILSDLASELSGSLGLAGSINANAELGLVCAQAQHGSAPDIQSQNIANPTSLILSAAMMLCWLGERRGLAEFRSRRGGDRACRRRGSRQSADAHPRSRRHHQLRCVRISCCKGDQQRRQRAKRRAPDNGLIAFIVL